MSSRNYKISEYRVVVSDDLTVVYAIGDDEPDVLVAYLSFAL
jgi:hypothetical protein